MVRQSLVACQLNVPLPCGGGGHGCNVDGRGMRPFFPGRAGEGEGGGTDVAKPFVKEVDALSFAHVPGVTRSQLTSPVTKTGRKNSLKLAISSMVSNCLPFGK